MADKEPIDIKQILIGLGADEATAGQIQGRMNGVDYLTLVNLLDDDTPQGKQKVEKLLAKYGVKIQKVKQMESKRLETIFQDMHKKGVVYESAGDTQWVRPISEMNSPAATMSGYSSFVRTANEADAEALVGWLEENEVDYQNNDAQTFLVQCSDRESAYRLNHFMGSRNGKTGLMDNLSESDQTLVANLKKAPFKGQFGEIIATEFGRLKVFGAEPTTTPQGAPDWNIIAQDAKGNIHKIQYDTANAGLYGRGGKFDFDETVMEKKPGKNSKVPATSDFTRNPVAQAGRMASGAGAHNSKDPRKKDVWDRNAKHKKSYMGESNFTQGQVVKYGESDVPVRVPAGPNGTVGILFDGKVKMVRENEIEIVSEGVLGMTKVDPLYRLKELAGVKSSPITMQEDPMDAMGDIDVADDFDAPVGDDMDSFDADSDMGVGAMDDTADFDAGLDAPEMGTDGMDIGGDDLGMASNLDGIGSDIDGDDVGGLPGSPDPMMGSTGVVAPINSDAYNEILDHLNNIQTSLGDVKLSEYRTLVAKLEDLAGQVRSMGRDYLGEQRKLKK